MERSSNTKRHRPIKVVAKFTQAYEAMAKGTRSARWRICARYPR
jgi:hypothetical protein